MDPFQEPPLANKNVKMNWVGFKIKLGELHPCVGGQIVSPSEFYLNPLKSWNALEMFQKELNYYFEERVVQDGQCSFPDAETLEPGFYVAVLTKYAGIPEWHRGLILNKLENQKYQIMLIDYGDIYDDFTIDDIRYLPEKFVKFPAQAIRCKLDFGNQLNKLHSWENFWEVAEKQKFLAILKDADLLVEFTGTEIDTDLANPTIWLVKMNKYDSNEGVKTERVDQQFVRELGENWMQCCEEEIKVENLNKHS